MSDTKKQQILAIHESPQEIYQPKPIPAVWLQQKYLIIPKILYFSLYMAYYTCYTFKGKFFKDVLGFSDSGFIYTQAAMYTVVWFGSTFWNYISDLTCRPKLVLTFGAVLMAMSFQMFLTVPLVPESGRKAFSLFITVVYTLAYSSVQPMLDGIVVHMLSTSSIEGVGKELYGRQRLWGTVGYGLVTLVVGKAIDVGNKEKPSRQDYAEAYMPMFYISAACTISFLLFFMLLTPNDDPVAERAYRERKRKAEAEKNAMLKIETGNKLTKTQEMWTLLKNPSFLLLLMITLFVGMCRQNLSTIRPMYTESYIAGENNKNKKLTVAICAITGLIPEIAMFWWGKPLLKRLGTFKLMIVSLLTIASRVWGYYLVPENNPDWLYFVYVLELLKGLSMGALQLAAVQMCVEIAGDALQTTAQGIYTGIYNGISGTAGCLISGAVMQMTDNKGYKINFLQSSIVTSLSIVLILVYPFLQKKRNGA